MISLRTRLLFLLMHCVLFAANELNNAPNSSRRVGGKVAFFPGPRPTMSGLPHAFPPLAITFYQMVFIKFKILFPNSL